MIDPNEYMMNLLNSNKSEDHDAYFSIKSQPWLVLISYKLYNDAEIFWNAICMQIRKIEEEESKKIHKGTLFYFWAVTCILNNDLEKGFLLMHQALEEDRLTDSLPQGRYPDSPAYRFVTLNYENMAQFFKDKVDEIARFLDSKPNEYRNSRGMLLNLDDFRSKFLEYLSKNGEIDLVFYSIYYLFRAERSCGFDHNLMNNDFSSFILTDLIFSICLVIDNTIKQKNTAEWKFSEHLEYLSQHSSLGLDKVKLREINGEFNSINRFSSALQKFLDSNFSFSDGIKPSIIEEDLAIAYGFRNFGAHKIEDQSIIHQRFDEILQRVFNVLFFIVEKLY